VVGALGGASKGRSHFLHNCSTELLLQKSAPKKRGRKVMTLFPFRATGIAAY
jgi:hypothetical protein